MNIPSTTLIGKQTTFTFFQRYPQIIEAIKKEQKEYIVLEPPNALKGRPIIDAPSSPMQHLSEILQKILSPIVQEQKSYV